MHLEVDTTGSGFYAVCKIDTDLREINCMHVEVDTTGSWFCAVCKIDTDLKK